MQYLEDLIRREVQEQRAYHAEPRPYPVILDANENPFPLPAGVAERFREALDRVVLRRYPDPQATALRGHFAASLGVPADMVMAGNGSDELIQILCTAVRPEAPVLVPTPTFAIYRIAARNTGHRVLPIALDGAFDLDLPAVLAAMEKEAPGIVFLAYPNNPTGNCFDRKKVEAVLDAAPGIVVVDEAYVQFSGQSFVSRLPDFPRLVLLRTLSKMGLAALRVGFLVASPALLAELHKVRLPFNLNALSQAGALCFFEAEEAFRRQAEEIVALRRNLYAALKETPGVQAWPTDANFIFFRCVFDGDRVYSALKDRGILVRNFHGPGPLENAMRVTVGTREENSKFIEAIREILKIGA